MKETDPLGEGEGEAEAPLEVRRVSLLLVSGLAQIRTCICGIRLR